MRRKTRKYPHMFGSVRRQKELRNRPVLAGPPISVTSICEKCVNEPICLSTNLPF